MKQRHPNMGPNHISIRQAQPPPMPCHALFDNRPRSRRFPPFHSARFGVLMHWTCSLVTYRPFLKKLQRSCILTVFFKTNARSLAAAANARSDVLLHSRRETPQSFGDPWTKLLPDQPLLTRQNRHQSFFKLPTCQCVWQCASCNLKSIEGTAPSAKFRSPLRFKRLA